MAAPSRAVAGARPPAHRDPAPGALLAELELLRADVEREGRDRFADWRPRIERRAFLPSGLNLACYLALRRRDLRGLQEALMPLGLSSLGRCEARVLPNLDAVIASLAVVAGADLRPPHPSRGAFFRGNRLLGRHTAAALGAPTASRQVRIMVTLPAEAAENGKLVHGLVARGMDVARINCSHDDAPAWEAMAANVRAASQATGRPCHIAMDLCGPRARTRALGHGAGEAKLEVGDRFRLVAGDPHATPPGMPSVSCSLPEIVPRLAPGETVWIDEGRLGAEVIESGPDAVVLCVRRTDPKGGKLRADKGLNFPDTDLGLSPLTRRDLRDLDTVARLADIVGYSFVQRREDVELLQRELGARTDDWRRLAIMAKIETGLAIRNLPEIIVAAAAVQPLAVMIARGDLAVEIGYPRLAEIQEELLWLCEAAHVPVVWATQVLDGFVRRGVPSRAEMTDIAMAERAECVMLNKGPFVGEAISILDDVLGRMESHQAKKTSRLRALHSW